VEYLTDAEVLLLQYQALQKARFPPQAAVVVLNRLDYRGEVPGNVVVVGEDQGDLPEQSALT
jgi:hypothetical protein